MFWHVLRGLFFRRKLLKKITEQAKRGKMWQVEAMKRSKIVVEIGGFYYSGILSQIHAL